MKAISFCRFYYILFSICRTICKMHTQTPCMHLFASLHIVLPYTSTTHARRAQAQTLTPTSAGRGDIKVTPRPHHFIVWPQARPCCSPEKHKHLSAKTCCVRGTTSVISSAFFSLKSKDRPIAYSHLFWFESRQSDGPLISARRGRQNSFMRREAGTRILLRARTLPL
jgi:hypothetical protein